MYFSFEFKSSVLLVFFFHAVVFSVLLFTKAIRNEHKPSFWLSAFTFFSGLYIAPFMLGYAGWYSRQPYRDLMFYIPFQQLYLFPPILYFYVKTLLDQSFFFSKKELIHFLPWLLYLMYSLVVLLADKVVMHEYYFYADGRDKDLSPWYQFTGFLSIIIYAVFSLRLYFNYKKLSYQTVSFADSILFDWVKRFLIALLLILILRGLFFVLNPEWNQFGSKFWYYLCFSILFYYISISGYVNAIQSGISFKTANIFDKDLKEVLDQEGNAQKYVMQNDLDLVDIGDWKIMLEQLMTVEKAYENPTLTLFDVAQKLGTNSKRISQIDRKRHV